MSLPAINNKSSFPRRRESNFKLGQVVRASWLPACAGMTIFIGLVFFQQNFGQAQDTAPITASQATDQPVRILIVGDAMAGGMGAGLIRMTANEPRYEVVNRFNEFSGIARPDRYDWATAIPKMMEGKEFSAAIVLIGLNDRQDIRNAASRLTFNTPEWTAAYKASVDAVLDALLAQNVRVIWLGQPPMGDTAYDADMQIVSALQKERVLAKGAQFVDLRMPFLGSDGLFSQRGPDENGVDQKLRQNDGVIFLKLGNNRLGQIALAAIKNDVVLPVPVTPIPESQVAVPPVTVDSGGPVFGQQDQNGAEVLHTGGDVVAAVATQSADAAAVAASSIGIAAAKDSAAEKLFTLGVSPAAPAGRFDDFSYTAPAQ